MDNPLLSEWQSSHQLPPFESISPEHFKPAFEFGFKEHNQDIEKIVNNPESPNFQNTIESLELAGETLKRISPVFYILTAANTNDELITLQSELIPRHTSHNSAINTRADLFNRVKTVFEAKPSINLEQTQLLQKTYKDMLRAGAGLSNADVNLVNMLDTKLATLQTQYSQNVLQDSNNFELIIEKEDLDGLPKSVRENASTEAESRGYAGKFLFTISRSSFTPFLQYSNRRDLRERLWNAYTHCANNNNEFDNKNLAGNIASLRAERAKLLGYASHAEYMLDDRMAETPSTVKGAGKKESRKGVKYASRLRTR